MGKRTLRPGDVLYQPTMWRDVICDLCGDYIRIGSLLYLSATAEPVHVSERDGRFYDCAGNLAPPCAGWRVWKLKAFRPADREGAGLRTMELVR